MVPHSNFTDEAVAYDVGIVKLQKPLPAGNGIRFATLASSGSDPDAGRMVAAAGW